MRRLLLRIAALWALYELLIDRIDPVELVAGVAVALIVAAVVRTPAGRWGAPEDFFGVAVFLASAASAFVTGTTIAVDGGYSASI